MAAERLQPEVPTADEIRAMDIPSWLHPFERRQVVGQLANMYRMPYAVTYPFADARTAKPRYVPITFRLSKVIEFAEQRDAAMAITSNQGEELNG